METEHILIVIIGGFFSALIIFLIILYKPVIPFIQTQSANQKKSQAVSSDTDSINNLKSKVSWLEKKANEQTVTLEDLQAFVSTQSAKPTIPLTKGKTVLDFASTKGGVFTTTSAAYAPMGMYVNVNCSKSCLLWINFYSSSKNSGSPASSQGNTNTYDVFLNNSDQSIFAQASYHADSSFVPISISVTIPVSAGVHTIDIRAKTTGGTLQSDSSGLQVMAIER